MFLWSLIWKVFNEASIIFMFLDSLFCLHKYVYYFDVRYWMHSIYIYIYIYISDQSLSRVRLFATPWIEACQASLSITYSQSSPKLSSIQSVMPPSYLILFSSCPQSLPASESFPMSQLFTWGGQSTGVSAECPLIYLLSYFYHISPT